ncbi:nitrogenase component 1 [Mitsuokella sp. UBA4253]|uniref:nitrogenase component 1 n=1 Tax=Mitsuokella sp. UBA4253 TaxID=1946959 RepID=UPI00257FD4EC|nr:nitrogenase component 1 [Mitsuokella sp. UBA4253]
MKHVARILSTYSADTFGVCSALYELGGMIVIHDPSGCNSTYTTHDEPRWFAEPSQIFISALTEQDAILGNDSRLIADITAAAQELQPRFICLIPSQIAHMIATDCRAICRILEKKTGIPAFTLPTNSMHYYERGIFFALQKLAELACQALPEAATPKRLPEAKWLSEEELHKLRQKKGKALRVNVLGATPLDFAMNGSIDSMRHWLEARGCHLASCWAMGSDLDTILASRDADLDLVVSYGGLGAARVLRERVGIPYRIGIPFPNRTAPSDDVACRDEKTACIIGETIFAESLARALEEATGQPFTAIVPMETDEELLLPGTLCLTDEDELSPVLREAALIIADPLYQPICPAGAAFLSLPHIAFSGRLYEKTIPNLIEEEAFTDFVQKVQKNLGKLPQNRV